MILINISCSSKISEEKGDFLRYNKFLASNKLFNQNNILQSSKIILCIPVDGCEDCVEKCTVFMKKNKNINYLIMATSKAECKKYKAKNNIEGTYGNLFFDENALSLKSGIYSAFPYIIYLDNNFNVENIVPINALNIQKELTQLNLVNDGFNIERE
jgi:hypothetical protein